MCLNLGHTAQRTLHNFLNKFKIFGHSAAVITRRTYLAFYGQVVKLKG